MKRVVFALIAAVSLTVGLSAFSYVLSNTTLNGAISATQGTLVLTSASASSGSTVGAPAAGQCLFVDRELMKITATSSTTMTVTRALQNASPHATAAVVFTGACNLFKTTDPVPSGNLSCTAQPQNWVNVNNGNVWTCDTILLKWIGTNAALLTYNSVRVAQ